jgi:alpha-tubulin suppressor-like RCC1 family protein
MKPSPAAQLDSDTLDGILVRLVARSGSAASLLCCSCVCRQWYAGSLNDELWRSLLLQRCGEGAHELIEQIEESQRAGREPISTYRAHYIRSVTTQVMCWGHFARSEEDACNAPRVPKLFEGNDGLRSLGIRHIAVGVRFACAVTWTGSVVCWGSNTKGQCGHDPSLASYVPKPHPLQMPSTSPYALQVSCGSEHAACITTCGAVLTWGSNTAGFTFTPSNAFLGDCAVPRCCQVACGAAHTVALSCNGQAFTWGTNSYGQCGRTDVHEDDELDASKPLAVPGVVAVTLAGARGQRKEQAVSRVAAGANFSLLVTAAGVFSFGANVFGQLGRETEDPHDFSPALVQLPSFSTSGGGTHTKPGESGGGAEGISVQDLSCGDEHSLVVLSGVEGGVGVYVWGRGTQGALGLGAAAKNVISPVLSQCLASISLARSLARLLVRVRARSLSLLRVSSYESQLPNSSPNCPTQNRSQLPNCPTQNRCSTAPTASLSNPSSFTPQPLNPTPETYQVQLPSSGELKGALQQGRWGRPGGWLLVAAGGANSALLHYSACVGVGSRDSPVKLARRGDRDVEIEGREGGGGEGEGGWGGEEGEGEGEGGVRSCQALAEEGLVTPVKNRLDGGGLSVRGAGDAAVCVAGAGGVALSPEELREIAARAREEMDRLRLGEEEGCKVRDWVH